MIERLLAAEAALDRADLATAHRLFEQVATADPRNAIAVVGLARVAARRNTPDEARAFARQALEIDPQEVAARRLLDELDAAATHPAVEPQPATPAAMPALTPPPPARQAAWRRWLNRLLHRR